MSNPRTWWAKRWPRTLESLGLSYPNARIVRGRKLTQDVDDLIISPGEITAWVDQPRRAYGVTIRMTVFDTPQWTAAFAALASRLHCLADLLDDRLPENIDRVLNDADLALFPGDGDMSTECPCTDRSATCVHVIAVHHAFATRFDDDPFLLPLLRGRDREALLHGIRSAMTSAEPPPLPTPSGIPLTALDKATFYTGTREALAAW